MAGKDECGRHAFRRDRLPQMADGGFIAGKLIEAHGDETSKDMGSANRLGSNCCQTSPYYLYDALVDFINGAFALDCDHTEGSRVAISWTRRRPGGKRGAFSFKSVSITSGDCDCALVAAARPLERAIEIRQ